MPRGAWHYDGEIDLGYGAGLRMAAAILTNDPVFGWIAYGGTLRKGGAPWNHSPGRVAAAVRRCPRNSAGSAGSLRGILAEIQSRARPGRLRPRPSDRHGPRIEKSSRFSSRKPDGRRPSDRASVVVSRKVRGYCPDEREALAVKPTGNPDYPFLAVFGSAASRLHRRSNPPPDIARRAFLVPVGAGLC